MFSVCRETDKNDRQLWRSRKVWSLWQDCLRLFTNGRLLPRRPRLGLFFSFFLLFLGGTDITKTRFPHFLFLAIWILIFCFFFRGNDYFNWNDNSLILKNFEFYQAYVIYADEIIVYFIKIKLLLFNLGRSRPHWGYVIHRATTAMYFLLYKVKYTITRMDVFKSA